MTRDEILKLEAGSELDALVAEKVKEWTIPGGFALWIDNNTTRVFRPSTDIAAAWEVFESDKFTHFKVDRTDDRETRYIASCATQFKAFSASADTAAKAISRVAVLAMMEE